MRRLLGEIIGDQERSAVAGEELAEADHGARRSGRAYLPDGGPVGDVAIEVIGIERAGILWLLSFSSRNLMREFIAVMRFFFQT